jgi:DNA-binding protein HU-beta
MEDGRLNTSEVIEELALRTGLGRSEARRVVAALFGTRHGEGLIADALERGRRVVLSGFGTFLVRDRPERTVRDPRTGLPRTMPPMRHARFRAGVALRDRLR